jgi:23S rRNA maturation-related 3'-5' exoribonuclease YhaM
MRDNHHLYIHKMSNAVYTVVTRLSPEINVYKYFTERPLIKCHSGSL